ncbi:MAG: hypothetical protein AAF615_07255 [Pseudomonadota bacterium]
MRPLSNTLRKHGAQEVLAAYLASDGAAVDAATLLAAAAEHRSADELARACGLKKSQPAGLALMIHRAETTNAADALAYTGVALRHNPDGNVRRLVRLLERNATREPGPYLTADGKPVIFVVSFPRSGNTRFLNILGDVFSGSRFTAFMHEGRYFSEMGTGSAANAPVFVKDHELRDAYRDNPVIYLARDGRDCALSYNDFMLRRSGTTAEQVEAASDTLSIIAGRESAGDDRQAHWPSHMNSALDWQRAGRPIAILEYNELLGDAGYKLTAGALELAGIDLDEAAYEKGVKTAENSETRLRTTNRRWGREAIYPAGSLMDRWLQTPGVSKWRDVLSPKHRKELHEADYTPALLEAGFEDDPSWWQS